MNPSKYSYQAYCLALLVAGTAAGAADEPVQSTWEDTMVKEAVRTKKNFEPMIVHPGEQAKAREKIEEFMKKNQGKRPNILLFVMDDVGWGDLGCYGGGEAVGAPTPTMDRLAREGLRLTSAYSEPSSSPTRATIMTGMLPIRHGILRPPMYGEKGGLDGLTTLPMMLKKADYVTQGVGKWHIGENVESQPQNVGFDDFYGFLSVSDSYTEWRDPYFYPEITNSPERTKMMEEMNFSKDLVHGQAGKKLEKIKEIDIEVLKMLDTEWTHYSVEFLNKMKTSDKPFFLYHCTRGAHFDNYPPPEFLGASPAKTPYRDTMVEMDHHLKTLVDTLAKNGQLENTLIFITSDNGPEMETWPDAGYTPFRGAKGSTFEGGMRVPGIFYWKGMIEPGQVSDGLFDLSDLYPTLLELAGVLDKTPSNQYVDGIDQTSFILNRNGFSNRQAVYYWLNAYLSGVRFAEYKVLFYTINDLPQRVVNPGGFSGELQVHATGSLLFNLYADPKEEHSFMVRKILYGINAEQLMKRQVETFKDFPPRAKPVIMEI